MRANGDGILKIGRKLGIGTSVVQRVVSDAGRATYNARVGAHDDLVLAVSISLRFATNMPTFSSEELRI